LFREERIENAASYAHMVLSLHLNQLIRDLRKSIPPFPKMTG